jgi:hypothetical protein
VREGHADDPTRFALGVKGLEGNPTTLKGSAAKASNLDALGILRDYEGQGQQIVREGRLRHPRKHGQHVPSPKQARWQVQPRNAVGLVIVAQERRPEWQGRTCGDGQSSYPVGMGQTMRNLQELHGSQDASFERS